jgi:branched-chain amino acid transport system substrate-binding protein
MNKRYTWSLIALVLLMVSSVLVGCAATSAPPTPTPTPSTPTPAAPAKTFTIGYIETLTGPSSDNLKVSAQGAGIAEQYINDHGGITVNGQKYNIKVSQQDNKYNAERAAAAATSLISEEGCKFITGGYPTFVTVAINTVAVANNVMYLPGYHTGVPTEYDPKVTALKFFPNDGTPDLIDGALGALKILHPEVKTIAHIIVDAGAMKLQDPTFKKIAQDNGLTQFDTIGFPPPNVDFTGIVKKAIDLNPDAILSSNGATEQSAGILKSAREQGYTKPIFMGNANPVDDVIKIAGPQASTNYFGYLLRGDTPNMPSRTKEIADIAVKQYGRVAILHIQGFSCIWDTCQAIEKAQSFDPAVVAKTFEGLDSMETGWGTSKMGGMERYGVRHMLYSNMPMYTVDNGVMTFSDRVGWVNIYRK